MVLCGIHCRRANRVRWGAVVYWDPYFATDEEQAIGFFSNCGTNVPSTYITITRADISPHSGECYRTDAARASIKGPVR
jgi:hypothetical protein